MKLSLPHPFVLLMGAVGTAVLMTWVVPAGEFQRRQDPATGRQVAIPGTYVRVDPAPVGLVPALTAVPRGIVAGADVIATVLFVGGAFALLESTGALARLVGALVGRTRRPRVVLAVVSLAFATMGALENMQEEIIALVPVLLMLSRGLGFGPVTALAMSAGAAMVGSAFGPTNPFQAGIARRVAELPPLTQPLLGFSLFVAAVALWIAWTLWNTASDDAHPHAQAVHPASPSLRDGLLLSIALAPFVPYVVGVLRFDWGFNELSGLFLVAGFFVGLVSGKTPSGAAAEFLKGMEAMLTASLFVGIARGISVVLTDGRILDTIVYALASPLSHLPRQAAALLMVPVHAAIHVPVSSVSGQAVLTMPIMAPLADLLGLPREAAVVAFQTGAGLMDLITPTSGALLAVLLTANVTWARWVRFAIPGALLVSLVGLAGILLSR